MPRRPQACGALWALLIWAPLGLALLHARALMTEAAPVLGRGGSAERSWFSQIPQKTDDHSTERAILFFDQYFLAASHGLVHKVGTA